MWMRVTVRSDIGNAVKGSRPKNSILVWKDLIDNKAKEKPEVFNVKKDVTFLCYVGHDG